MPGGFGGAGPASNPSLHRCGQGSLALVPAQGRVYQLDAAATAIAAALLEGRAAEAVAAAMGPGAALADVRRIRDALWPGAAAPQAGGVLRWEAARPPPGRPVARRRYRVLGLGIDCGFLDEAALRLAAPVLEQLEMPGVGHRVTLAVAAEGGTVRLWREKAGRPRERLVGRAPPGMLVALLRLALAETALEASGEGWAVHAAAVACGGAALLLPGEAGRGKSTLALALGRQGCTILGDDTVVLGAADHAVLALPFPISLKAGSWELATGAAAGSRLDGVAVRWLGGAGVPLAAPDARVSAAAILFPQFAAGAPTALRRLGLEEAMALLLPGLHPLGEGLTAAKLEGLIGWAAARPCLALRYGSTEEGVAAVRARLG